MVLTSGRGLDLDPAPGRVLLVPATTTLQDLAEAIDAAFARWDRSHLYVFDLGDQWTHVGSVRAVDVHPEEEWGGPPPGPVVIDAWGWIPDQYGREEEEPDD